jgi:hypothetical protein
MHSTASWCNQDLFFLADALRRGMSFAAVAGFLGRGVGEVRDKAKHIGIKVRHINSGGARSDSAEGLRAYRAQRR